MDLPDTSKEYFWCAKLDKKTKVNQWEGRDDGMMEQLVLKRACIAPGAKDGERNLVEVTSFNHKQEKVEACICSLRSGSQEDVALADLTIFPPAIFKLIQGNGPIHIVGNHMMMDDNDEDSEQDQDYFSEEEGSELSAEDSDVEEEQKPKGKVAVVTNGKDKKKEATKAEAKKDVKKVEVVEEDDDEMDDEDDDDLMIEDEDDDEDEEEEEEVKPVPASKKRKLAQKEGNENKKPNEGSPQKKKKSTDSEPKTPLQQKENKAPLSAKKTPKTPAKIYDNIDEVKDAIKKYPGGKPRKEDKFGNWVKSAFKVKNDEWIKELWKAHKKELGL